MARRSRSRLTRAEGRSFGLTVGGAFLVLSLILWWREHPVPMWVTGGLGGALVFAGLLIPGRLGPVYDAWMGLAHAISRVTTPIFLAVVYFLVITPVGLLRRTIGRNPVDHHADGDSYWIPRDPEQPSSMERQF